MQDFFFEFPSVSFLFFILLFVKHFNYFFYDAIFVIFQCIFLLSNLNLIRPMQLTKFASKSALKILVFNLKVKVEPTPKFDVTSKVPPITFTIFLQILNPSPWPFLFISKLTGSVVLKKGKNKFF